MGDQLAEFDILNYTTTLIGWAQSTSLPFNISFNGGDSLYQSAEAAYNLLVNTYNWSFTPIPTFISPLNLVVQYNQPTTQYLLLNEPMLAYQPVYLSEYTDLVFTVAPQLPAGLNINASTGLISGTPTVLAAAQSYTVKTTANNGAIQATNNLTFAVSDLVTYSTLLYTFVKDTLITPIVPTVATGRIISIYAISPALPEGLVFDTTLGTITGTPTTTQKTDSYTITAVYNDVPYVNTMYLNVITPDTGTFDILNYTTTIIGWAQSTSIPSNISFDGGDNLYQSAFNAYKKLTQTYNWTFIPVPVFLPTPALDVQYNEPTTQYLLLNEAMLAYQPVYLSSSYTDFVFTIAPQLPTGLNINASTGLISGTPTVLTATQSYIVKTTANQGRIQALNTLTFAVMNLVTYTPLVYNFKTDRVITPVVPTIAPGRIISIYAISPALPEGLVFDTTLGTITGTPTKTLTTTIYTITAVYDNISYINNISLTITLPDPFILQFANVPVNFVVALPLYVALISTTFKVNWGDGSPETTNILKYRYNNTSITSYTVQVYILTGTIDTFGELNWPGVVYLRSITGWDNLLGIRKLRGIGGAALISVPDSLPNTVRDISYMFSGATQFNQDLSTWDVSKVLEMSAVFQNARSFNQPLNGWQVGNVTVLSSMFEGATRFNQDLSSWDVRKVLSMYSVFLNASSFNKPLNSWQVGNVTSLSQMFAGAAQFNQPLNSWQVEKVVDLSSMFAGATRFNQDLSTWQMGNAINMAQMFLSATNFNQPLNGWDVSKVTSMKAMFSKAASFNQPLNNWQVGNVMDMNSMFSFNPIFNQDLSGWDVSKVTTMTQMFNGSSMFNQPLNSWQVGNVADMSFMFRDAIRFNQPLNNWNVGKVGNMTQLFNNASSFNQDLSAWQVGEVIDMSFMFRNAPVFNQPLNTWNVGKVVNIESMFSGAINFNQPLNDWDVSKVVDMSFLFYRVKNFNQDLSAWNVSRVIDMRSVFSEAPSFNQDLSSWDVSSATQMSYMFYQGTSFNQNLGNWNVSQVKTMDNMFTDTTSFDVSNYSATLTGWASLPTLQNNVPLNGGSALYQAAQSAYTHLITAPYVWQITPVPKFLLTPALSVQYNQSTTRTYKTNSTIIPYQPTVYSIYSDVFFSITPALPSGLSINVSNGTISGTPNVFSPQATYKVNATANAGQVSVQILLRFSVASDFYYPSNSVFLNEVVINPLEPIVADGITITSYAIAPNLTTGLNFNTVSGAITGTPRDASLNQIYTITGTKPNKTIATYSITLSVADISYANVPYVYAQNAEFLYSPFNGKPIIPTRYDADFFNSIVLKTPLPVELAIDLSDGIIYGIPYTATPQKNYILTATTISGYTKDIELSITVNGFSYTEDGSEPIYTLNVFDTVKIVVLINVGGYTDFISYPNLPAGLTLDNATGSIFGTVSEQVSSTEVYFISGLIDPVITIPITIIIKSNNYPPVCQYKCPPHIDIPRQISTINTNAMRYSTLVRTGLGQTRFIANSGTNINDAYTQPIRNKF